MAGGAGDVTDLRVANEALGTLRRAIENSPTAVIITNRQGTIEYVNPKFSEVTGFSVEECLGRNPRVLKSGVHGREFYKQLWNTVTQGNVWRGELCNRKKNGDLYWEYASIAPVKNAQGEITHFVAVKEDITERRRIEQSLRDSERRAKMAMDLALLVHWELDVANRMYTFDDQFYALYGTSVDREGGADMSVAEYTRRFLPPEEQPLVDEEIRLSLANADSGEVRRLEHRIIRADGEERFIAACYQIQRNAEGEVVAIYGANQDITERKRAERQLAEAKARTDAANRELEQSLERQRELEKLKEQLVSLLVHDLKSPLGAMLVNVSYLGSGESDEAEKDEILAEVIAATQAMHRMVMDMLDVMRVDERGLLPKRRPVDIGSLLREAARPAIAQARRSGPRIQVETPAPAFEASIDADLVRRVLENLLDNALKYAPTSTAVIVRAGWLDGQLRLEVLDDGPGIPEHERERIFEPYARLGRDDGNKARQSRGLGLAFCKLAVEAHGGRISVRNRVPRGAAFIVEIPG
jgi:PAS domain S-box-containing protein